MTEVITALSTTVGLDVWYKRLEHPTEQVVPGLQDFPEPGVNV